MSLGASFSAALVAEDFPWVEKEEEMGMAPDKYREVFDLARRGVRAFRERRFDEGISCYSKAQNLRSGDPIILSNRSSAFCMISQLLRERSAADSEYQPLNGLDPTTHAELALKDAEKVIAICSNSPRPYLLKAYALILLERYHEAREALLAGLQVDPLSHILQTCLSDLDRNTNIAAGPRRPRLDRTDDFECTLCFKLLFEPVTTPCGHSFCRSCLHQSMDHGNKCPMCRTVLFIGPRTYPISVTLSNIIQKYFPEEYAERKSEHETTTYAGVDLMPLFVMDVVLPCQKMELNIFEPRYRLMVRRIMEGNHRMGMVAIDSATGTVADCGCAVEILECEPLPDGRFYLEVEGSRRFRILRSWDQDGYRVAEIEWFQDIPLPEGSQEKKDLIERTNGASELARTYIRRARESIRPDAKALQKCFIHEKRTSDMGMNHVNTHQKSSTTPQGTPIARRPDMGGVEGAVIPLSANHFLVRFNPGQKIFHYDVDISPHPSKETARIIKKKLVEENSSVLSGAMPAFDGRRNLYSPIEFQEDKVEFFVSLQVASARRSAVKENGHMLEKQKFKLFKVNIRLVSKLSGEDLNKYLNEEKDGIPLPQDYLHALDVILREGAMESSIPVGRSLYARSMGEARDIGGGAVGLRGFFQSLRPTKQGLALNVDLSLTAFHESTGIIAYLQKRCDFLKDLSQNKTMSLSEEERREVEKALKNIRVFVCHRETDQRYHVHSLTEETTENLKFRDRSGKDLMVVDYFKEHYSHDIQFRNLPCLQIGRSKPCYVPMELCVVCEGQKFLGKLSDEQTSKILKMGCQRPSERKGIIKGVVEGAFAARSNSYADQFNLQVSKDMTQLSGRVLLPPKLKLGSGGRIKDVTPDRFDRQWNLLDSHVAEGSKIKSWALISFGGTPEQHSCIPKFVNQLSSRCEQLGILLNKKTVISPLFERIQLLNNVGILESKLKKIQEAASGNLQLLICVMERKHRGYADLKRIAETSIGVVTQCCLYSNLSKLTSQFLANLALKMNVKLGGCNVALYNSLPCQIPRIFSDEEPVMFMGADVAHPHPLDDLSPSVVAVVASMNWPSANKYISRMRSQTHRKEIIEQLDVMAGELLEEFLREVGKLPSRIIFFRDGVSETQFYKVLKEEMHAVRMTCSRYPGYKPFITFIVVQKRHHTRFFHREKNGSSTHYSDQNIPPGTVVDTVITHPREFDFYLCSHWGTKGTSRPTHYHVLWDENNFQSDEVQQLIHNLCYTFARCTKPVSLVPPAYYAHLAAYRGRLYLERSDSTATSRTTLYRATPLQTTPLPKLRDSVKRLMFYC